MDHLHDDPKYEPHSNGTFANRYYFDDTYYRPGGPVIALNGAEASVTYAMSFLQYGIIKMLAEATGGMGVIFEHRYYGESFPTVNLTTENYRFHTSDQAMADMVYFAEHAKFPRHEHEKLNAKDTPWIWYGGSYAGALVAMLRKKYPERIWGAVSSSSALEPVVDFWPYYEPIRKYAEENCIEIQVQLVEIIDNILLSKDQKTKHLLKSAFGLEGVRDDRNFALAVTGGGGQWQARVQSTAGGMGLWQSRQWVTRLYSGAFEKYCSNITSTKIEYPDTKSLKKDVQRIIQKGGQPKQKHLVNHLLNLIGYARSKTIDLCDDTQEMCFSQWTNATASFFTDKSIENNVALSWPYQYCTEWGCLPTGDIPKDAGLKPLVSRLIDDDYNRLICKHAFGIETDPDLEAVLSYGGRNFSFPRVAHIGGQFDNWGIMSPVGYMDQEEDLQQTGNTSEPKILMKGAGHGWDLFGIPDDEEHTAEYPPPAVTEAQKEIVRVVKAWVADFKRPDEGCH